MKRLIAILLWAWAAVAAAQTSPGFITGQTLGAAQLNAAFAAKTDFPFSTMAVRGLSAADIFVVQPGGTTVSQQVTAGALASFINSTSGFAPINSPTFTGVPRAPTAAPGDVSTQLATDAFVNAATALLAPRNSPTFTGIPTAPTAAPGDNTQQLATDAFVGAAVATAGTAYAPINSPNFTGIPTGPTAAPSTNTSQLATTAFVIANSGATGFAPIANPVFIGTVTLPVSNYINGPNGSRALFYQTAGVNRWALYANGTAETGGNIGSDFSISRWNDAGTTIDVPFNINRASGMVTLNNLTVGGTIAGNSLSAVGAVVTGGNLTLGAPAAAGGINFSLQGTAGTTRQIVYYSASTPRWTVSATATAEGGSNTGSDYNISRFTDAGTAIDQPLAITRSNGIVSMGDGAIVAAPPANDNSTRAVNSSWVDARGAQVTGQIVISTSTTLGASQLGANVLVSGSGVTITFPSTSGTYWLSNTNALGGAAVTMVFPTGTDFRAYLEPGEQVGLAGDGGGFWRTVASGQAHQIWTGVGVPTAAMGANNDFFFNTTCTHGTSSCTYHKEGGAWFALN